MIVKNFKYFYSSTLISLVGLFGAGCFGFITGGGIKAALEVIYICFVLSLLEISLSFDNAIVNAKYLQDFDEVWRKRFLTWGMWIAVFGMRLLFPLLIVCLVAKIGPIDALVLAFAKPKEYSEIMLSVKHEVSAFGGAFLMMVALKYFFDAEKDVHWVAVIEKPLIKLGKLESVEVGITLLLILIFSRYAPEKEAFPIVVSGIFGILVYLAVDAIGYLLSANAATGDESSQPINSTTGKRQLTQQAQMGAFLYLEVLDASFSFDGVVGAFAITQHLFTIMIGLSIGALYVRSLTLFMVDKGALGSFLYLENGAFWAIGSLAFIMFFSMATHVSEIISGSIGLIFIGLSIWSSYKHPKPSHS